MMISSVQKTNQALEYNLNCFHSEKVSTHILCVKVVSCTKILLQNIDNYQTFFIHICVI